MTHFSRRVARAALIAAAGAAVPLIGAASAQASSLPLGNNLTGGVTQPDAAPVTGAAVPAAPAAPAAVASPADKLAAVAPAANEAVGQTAGETAPKLSGLADSAGSLTGHAPALGGGLPL